MREVLGAWLVGFEFLGNAHQDAPRLLEHCGLPHVGKHLRDVARTAKNLAERFGLDASAAELAGILHDVGVFVPEGERVALSQALGLPVLPEEQQVPMILHQQHSRWMAESLFGVHDQAVLSAIGCHTTLKSNASQLDQVVFLADKISWDQPGQPPYLHDLLRAFEVGADLAGLDAGTRFFLQHLISSPSLLVVHPWLRDAHQEWCS